MDDIVIMGNDQDGIQRLKQHLFSHFKTKDLGKLKYFLGIEIGHSKSVVIMNRRKYALEIDTKYGMKSDNFLYFRLTIHLVYIGDYKRRKKETRDIKRKLTYS